MICGSGSVVIVNCAVCGSTSIFARTICVCSLNGPAMIGTTIDRPYGAPSYGPGQVDRGRRAARLGDLRAGTGPGRPSTTVCPICEAAGHVPAFACGSPHSGTLEIIPEQPLRRLELQARDPLLPIATLNSIEKSV